MQLAIDPHDRSTAYADLREDERLTDELRLRATTRARELSAKYVEFWREPFGRGADRMAGFVELVRVADTAAPEMGADRELHQLVHQDSTS